MKNPKSKPQVGADKRQVIDYLRNMELTLYIKPWCRWCIEAVAWLEERGYQFSKIDVLSDPIAYQRMRRVSSQSLTPTLETSDGLVLPDFDVAQLEKFMLKHALLP